MRFRLVFLAACLLAACGGGGGGGVSVSPPGGGPPPPSSSPAPSGAPSSNPSPSPGGSPSPHTSPTPVGSPSPGGTPTPIPLSAGIIYDTNPSTSGVFIGESCIVGSDYLCAVEYPRKFYHSLSANMAFTNWSVDWATYIPNENMAAWVALGVTPIVTWQPNGINYTDVISGKWDAYLTSSAQAIKAFGSTIFLRPFHEFNGDWTSYGLANQGADALADQHFITAWQHMVNVFRQVGANNVKWVWCYANKSQPDDTTHPWNNPVNAYPGDSYVDWVAFDAYNRGNQTLGKPWLTFDQLISASYARALGISPTKPLMIPEFGVNEWGDGGTLKAEFFTQMFNEIPTTYPHIRALIYFDFSVQRYGYFYALTSSYASQNAWELGMRSLDMQHVLNYRGYGAPMNKLTTWQQ
jgi:hypothetical protein